MGLVPTKKQHCLLSLHKHLKVFAALKGVHPFAVNHHYGEVFFTLALFQGGASVHETFSLLLKKTFTGNKMKEVPLKGAPNGSLQKQKQQYSLNGACRR